MSPSTYSSLFFPISLLISTLISFPSPYNGPFPPSQGLEPHNGIRASTTAVLRPRFRNSAVLRHFAAPCATTAADDDLTGDRRDLALDLDEDLRQLHPPDPDLEDPPWRDPLPTLPRRCRSLPRQPPDPDLKEFVEPRFSSASLLPPSLDRSRDLLPFRHRELFHHHRRLLQPGHRHQQRIQHRAGFDLDPPWPWRDLQAASSTRASSPLQRPSRCLRLLRQPMPSHHHQARRNLEPDRDPDPELGLLFDFSDFSNPEVLRRRLPPPNRSGAARPLATTLRPRPRLLHFLSTPLSLSLNLTTRYSVTMAASTDPVPLTASGNFTLPPITLQDLPHLSPTPPSLPTPLSSNPYYHPFPGFFISPSDVIVRHILFDLASPAPAASLLAYRRAGPRKAIHFDPARSSAAVVTCGGLCPGMNTVIRELVVGLWELYGVRDIFGITSGYRGFYADEPVRLDPKMVHDWHKRGGTVLATSRGGFDLDKIVDAIQKRGFNQVYCIGGDGTMRGAVKIFQEVQRRKLNISITGIPKTVDNDIGIIDCSFGFQTAVEMAQEAINAAHVEAESAVNGIGLVKLMGRSTGHIALHATLSSRDVDCCLIPENDFYLEGKGGLFEFLDQRLKQNGHAVIVVAEGAGQDVIPRTKSQKEERDESGNLVFLDVGPWLKSELKRWWERDHKGELGTVKFIDPTYMIRAVPANATDNLYCTLLAHSSLHGVMAGYTGFVSGPINGNYAYIPLEEVAVAKNAVNTTDHKWAWVRSVTNQPDFLKAEISRPMNLDP